ncbi:MAG TPA: hypothetical protein VFL29_04420 [Candidatus Dormibacteraeota bacterium]|nr:hypothetical protein [Candidatus Dormibacteraeota bacterium]
MEERSQQERHEPISNTSTEGERIEQRREPERSTPAYTAGQTEPVGKTPSEMSDYKRRFDHLQVDFIDDPKETVKKAEKLVEEAVERMVSSIHERVNRIHSELGDGTDDTERLRLVMRRYREFMDSFVSGRAA